MVLQAMPETDREAVRRLVERATRAAELLVVVFADVALRDLAVVKGVSPQLHAGATSEAGRSGGDG